MKKFFLLATILSAISLHATPGDLVSIQYLSGENASLIPLVRQKFCPGITSSKVHSFKRYKVTFKTVDLKNQEVESTGLMMIPDASGPQPMLVYQHGTLFGRAELPSSKPQYAEGDAIGFCVTSLGYVSVLADYLGFGDGTGPHPYLHAESEAYVARDMMRAVRIAVKQVQTELNDQIFITGYSQGGHAAMSLLRYLEQDPVQEFKVTAAAPMAGPYALSKSIGEIVNHPTTHSSAEAAYLVMGLNPIYGFFTDLSEVIQAPSVNVVSTLFDGTHNWDYAIKNLPPHPVQLIQPEFLKTLADVNSPFMKALEANEVYQWTPKAPVHLYHGRADFEVPYSNSELAYNYMKSQGADVELISLGPVDHSAGFLLGVSQAALWFESLR